LSDNRIDIVPSPYLLSDLIVVKAVTPVHAGIGRTGGVVDLPIQRDEYGYPCIYSSSLKGALKTALLQAFLEELEYDKARKAVQALLGPEPEEGESFESSIALLDAYLFAMPVRSLKGVYAYVTSPLSLKRFYEGLELLTKISKEGEKEGEEKNIANIDAVLRTLRKIAEHEPQSNEAVCVGEKEECEILKVSELDKKLVLAEEYFLDIKDPEGVNVDEAKKLNMFIKKVMGLDKPLLVLSDSLAKSVIERGVLRYTRVRLRRETKTVERGGLWSEEYLPHKTTLYSIALYKKPPLSANFIRKILEGKNEGPLSEDNYFNALKELRILKDEQLDKIKSCSPILEKMQTVAEAVRSKVRDLINQQLKGYLILGGHETIGKGIVHLKLFSLKELENTLIGGA